MIKRIKTLQTSCLYTIFSLITNTHSPTHTRNDLWTLLGIYLQPLLANRGMILAWSYKIVRSSQHLCYELPFSHPTNKPTTEHCSLAHTLAHSTPFLFTFATTFFELRMLPELFYTKPLENEQVFDPSAGKHDMHLSTSTQYEWTPP